MFRLKFRSCWHHYAFCRFPDSRLSGDYRIKPLETEPLIKLNERNGGLQDGKLCEPCLGVIFPKIIYENFYLTDEEKEGLCRITLNVRYNYIRVSTGDKTGRKSGHSPDNDWPWNKRIGSTAGIFNRKIEKNVYKAGISPAVFFYISFRPINFCFFPFLNTKYTK